VIYQGSMPWSVQSLRSPAAFGLALALAGALAAPAEAQRFRVVDASIAGAETGAPWELTGSLEFGVASLRIHGPPEPGTDPFAIVDFDLAAGGRALTPQRIHTFEGLSSALLSLRPSDALELQGDRVTGLHLLAGGAVTESTEDTVTFRDWTFAGSSGVAFDREASGGGLPVRFVATGTLTAVDTRYRIQREPCPLVLRPSGGVLLSRGTGDAATIQIAQIAEIADRAQIADRDVDVTRQIAFADEAVTLTAIEGPTIPFGITLEELGINAPDGAVITVDATGHVTVESDGDLEIDAGALEIEGLTRLTILSQSKITVGPLGIELPDGVPLELRAAVIEIVGPIDVPPIDPDPDPVIVIPTSCPSLIPIDRTPGTPRPFDLEAALELPVAIALMRGHGRRGRAPVFQRTLSVAILGSEDLDVRDLDPRSLRLGPDEAAWTPFRRGRGWTHRRDVNRDGQLDLVVRFAARDAGLAPGDAEICLTGATWRGPAIAGCAAQKVEPQRGRSGRTHRR